MIITNAPRGTKDILPSEIYKWQYLEKEFTEICRRFGFREIRFPTFEHTELFERGVGDTTDVVEKQMYTFNDKGNRSITLRPEGTASAARCYIQNSLYDEPAPNKFFYNIPCFRYEKSQKGRLREFHQFGTEVFGAAKPSEDAEVISLALMFLNTVGLTDLTVNINSIGCKDCRKAYNDALKEFLRPKYDELCDTCKNRFERNPLRILDCKSEICRSLTKDAPKLLDYLCDDCREHFEALKKALDDLDIKYVIDPGIVRGLDYYTKTVFEIISGDFTVCGGGRYDGLIEQFGGKPTPAIGFGLGIERLLLRLEETGAEIPHPDGLDIYIAGLGEKASAYADKLCHDLRQKGISADTDRTGRGLRAQMKYADKLGCTYTVVLGENEINSGKAKIKNMKTGEEKESEIEKIFAFVAEEK